MHGERWGSWSGADAHTGSLTSTPFAAPPLIALRVAGGTTEPGETITIERVDGSGAVPITTAVDAAETYVDVLTPLPPSWWGKPVRLVAMDRGAEIRGWLGIADLRGADIVDVAEESLDRSPWLQLFFFVAALTIVLVLPAVACGAALAQRLQLDANAAFPLGLVVLGMLAEMVFFVGRFGGPTAGAVVTLLAVAVLLGGAAWAARTTALRRVDVWAPSVAATAAAVLYGAILVAAPLHGGSLTATAGLAWLALPPDNMLPALLADQVANHVGPRPFLAEWLSSDRPPLQAGLTLIARWLFPIEAWHDSRYEAISMIAQTWVFGAMWSLARALGFTRRRTAAAIALCLPSGFFFLNSIYVWPKLDAAAYGLAAIALVLPLRFDRRSLRIYALAGCAFALGMLCHAGVAFTLPVIAAALLVAGRRKALAPLGAALAALVIVSAPWTAYQKFYDPPGDRLVKWHLAGQIEPDPGESVLHVIARAYGHKTPPQIIAMKYDNLSAAFEAEYGARNGEFFFLRTALGVLLVPLFWALFCPYYRTALDLRTRAIAWIGLGSVVAWCLAMWAGTVIHQGSYLTFALLFVAAALCATRSAVVGVYVAASQTLIFSDYWLLDVVPPAYTSALMLATFAAVAVFAALTIVAPGRRSRTPASPLPALESS